MAKPVIKPVVKKTASVTFTLSAIRRSGEEGLTLSTSRNGNPYILARINEVQGLDPDIASGYLGLLACLGVGNGFTEEQFQVLVESINEQYAETTSPFMGIEVAARGQYLADALNPGQQDTVFFKEAEVVALIPGLEPFEDKATTMVRLGMAQQKAAVNNAQYRHGADSPIAEAVRQGWGALSGFFVKQ